MRIIRRKELKQKIGYSDMHVGRLEKAGTFPKRVKLGPNSVGWIEAEVDAWIEARAKERNWIAKAS